MQVWPQITFLVLSAAGAGYSLCKDKDFSDAFGTLLAVVVTQGLLYAGGFYAVLVH